MTMASVDAVDGETRWSADELIPFGKYILLQRLSSGATAAVYRAKIRGEAGFERVVAIKRILPHMAGDPEFVETFVREAKTTARLNHTNICPIYELGKVGESLYMAMEFVPGKDLRQLRQRVEPKTGCLPPVVSAWIAAKLCDALDYAHNLRDVRGANAGVIHRDLSPANVVISYEGQVKLIDFGLAKAVGRAQQTNVDALKEKLGYMSPEMVKGKPIDARSDVFGVGVLLYEMVTAHRLFEGKDDMATLTKVGRASFPPPSALVEDPPEDLELIIMRALERDPDARYQSAADMGEALMRFVLSHDPMFSPRKLGEFMMNHFSEECTSEQARTIELLSASNDPGVIEARKRFFMSAAGMVARARAEAQRKHLTAPGGAIPAAPRLPKEARAPGGGESYPPLQGDTRPASTPPTDGGFGEDEPTAFAGVDHDRVAAARGKADRSTVPARQGKPASDTLEDVLDIDDLVEDLKDEGQAPLAPSFDEEPTGFFDNDPSAVPQAGATSMPVPQAPSMPARPALRSSSPPSRSLAATVPPPARRRADSPVPEPTPEATEFLDGDELRGMAVGPDAADGPDFSGEATEFLDGDALEEMGAYPVEMAGFDEDATEIFFNTEDGAGLPEMLAAVQASAPPSAPPGHLRPPPAMAAPSGSPRTLLGMAPPSAAGPGSFRQAPPAMAAPVPAGLPQAPAPMAAPAPAPVAAPMAAAPAATLPGGLAARTQKRSRRITAQMAAAEIRRAERNSTIILAIGLVLLGLVAGLVATTRVGVMLGLRKPSTGAIEVRTKPAVRASIKLDEVYRGQAPLRMEGVRAGPHVLEVEMDGYTTLRREVVLEGGTTALLDVAMLPKPGGK